MDYTVRGVAKSRLPGLLCPSKLGSLLHPGSWERGIQPKLLGIEPCAHCLPSPELQSQGPPPRPNSQHQLGDEALWGHATRSSQLRRMKVSIRKKSQGTKLFSPSICGSSSATNSHLISTHNLTFMV